MISQLIHDAEKITHRRASHHVFFWCDKRMAFEPAWEQDSEKAEKAVRQLYAEIHPEIRFDVVRVIETDKTISV